MGTRGAYGFRKGGVDKISYNHFDSYPSGLGAEIAKYCLNTPLEELGKAYDAITMVDQDTMPTVKQQKQLKKYFKEVGTGRADDWYALLRGTQGDIGEAAKCGFMIDNHGFMLDSLFCEYAYVINLDTGMLEVYEGFQKDGAAINGRYKGAPVEGYWGVSLIAEIPIDDPELVEKVVATEQGDEE